MRVELPGGFLSGARQRRSPNCDERPAGCVPSLVVLHGISLPPGEFGGDCVDRLFCNRLDPQAHPYFATIAGLRVSSHLLIRRDGEVVQYVPFALRAWHAGESRYFDREACNDFSIGIELEGADECEYSPAQYASLVRAVRALCDAYPALDAGRIVGHCDIAPGRKTDPGPSFDWPAFYRALGAC